MDLANLVGRIFQENQLYEILHFDIEQNLENYLSKFVHVYFDRLSAGQIQINEVVYMTDQSSLFAINRKIIGSRGWIEIYNQCRTINLMICRQDRSGKFSVIGPDINHVQTFRRNDYDVPEYRELTPEEEREAFAELAGLLEDHIEISKYKKTV